MNKKISEYGYEIGDIKKGKRNSITDVEGVKVGHVTISNDKAKTGVTAILPHGGNIFKEKVLGATNVINGFGKSLGLIQIDELGTIETPIILTNTLSVGTGHQALVKYMLRDNEDIGDTTGTVNPIVCECNDGLINDIRGLHVTEDHILEALENCSLDFQEGSVGAGRGMVCYDFKGGIGSSSRLVNLGGKDYTIGVLVLTNFGSMEDFLLGGNPLGKSIKSRLDVEEVSEDKGSIIVILATDIPLSSRQLKRVIKRVYPGISRTGSYTGNGSGEVVIGFSTGNRINHYEDNPFVDIKIINEDKLNQVFKATVYATEEAILNSLVCSDTSLDRKGKRIFSLREFL